MADLSNLGEMIRQLTDTELQVILSIRNVTTQKRIALQYRDWEKHTRLTVQLDGLQYKLTDTRRQLKSLKHERTKLRTRKPA